jgi:glycosyltransferase involved in cell wall biosynthesis
VLLTTLLRELRGLEGRVTVIIGNNASTDRTADVMAAFASNWDDTHLLHHETNTGMDGNFCGCVELVRTPYFWVMGDDDLPRAGALRALLPLIEGQLPDLVYMNSRWLPAVTDNWPADPIQALQAEAVDRLSFARRTHVWTTYLSGMIVRSPPLIRDPLRLRRYAGTQLSQLAWVLPVLRDGSRFIHVTTCCVLATAGNTGGYKVLRVFGQHFPEIVHDALAGADPSNALARAILRRTAVAYLPSLIWRLRQAKLGRFENEDARTVLRPQFGGSIAFFCLLSPLGHAPLPVARLVMLAAAVASRAVRLYDRLVELIHGTVKPVRS